MPEVTLYKCDLDETAMDVLRPIFSSGQLTSGAQVVHFEAEIAVLVDGRPAVAMGDATHALALALQLAGVRAGDEVLTLSFNCLSSTTAISAIGAVPVWVDVDPATATMSLDDAAAAITPRTRAAIVYHVAGYPADIRGLRRICDERGVCLIEDANCAVSATVDGRPVGTFGDFAVLSLYANRQINAIEGAVLVCGDEELAERARRLRRFGIDARSFRDKYGEINPESDIQKIGISSPLCNVNAAIARHSLGLLGARLRKVRHNARTLASSLENCEGIVPVRWSPHVQPAFWVFLVTCRRRDQLLVDLKRAGIQCSKLHHPNHFYTGFGTRSRKLPGTEALAESLLGLPCGWWLEDSDINHVVAIIRSHLGAL